LDKTYVRNEKNISSLKVYGHKVHRLYRNNRDKLSLRTAICVSCRTRRRHEEENS
jgi:hypothetical protein